MMKRFYGIFIMLIVAQVSFAQQKVTVPQLQSPENGFEYVMPDVILDWDAVSGVGEITYHMQLATDDAFADIVVDQSNLTLTAYENQYLSFGQQYFWRVEAIDDSGSSGWSEVFNFTIFSTCELSKPRDGDDGVDIRPNLKWKAKVGGTDILGVGGFDIEMDTVDTFDSPYDFIFNIEGNVFIGAPDYLLFGKVIYWRLRPMHAEGFGAWSETWSFETVPNVKLKSPSNNASNQEFDAKLKWTDLTNQDNDIFEYTVELSLDENFTEPIPSITNDFIMVLPNFVRFGTEYFWRVRAAHVNDTSMWSDSRSFSMVNNVTLSSPADGSNVNTLRPKLEWRDLAGVDGYELRYSKNADMSDAQYEFLDADVLNFNMDPLDTDANYYWSVRAYRTIDTCAWADNFSFYVPDNIGIQELKNVSNLEVYPNPANTAISLAFLAKEDADFTIAINNILGESIAKETVNVSSGKFQKTYDISQLNSGIYFFEVSQGERKNMMKFVVK